jgi:hypothetical protein
LQPRPVRKIAPRETPGEHEAHETAVS